MTSLSSSSSTFALAECMMSCATSPFVLFGRMTPLWPRYDLVVESSVHLCGTFRLSLSDCLFVFVELVPFFVLSFRRVYELVAEMKPSDLALVVKLSVRSGRVYDFVVEVLFCLRQECDLVVELSVCMASRLLSFYSYCLRSQDADSRAQN